MSKTYLCWHLPDGSPERGEEVKADDAAQAAREFAETFFNDNEGEWLGGEVMVQELDARLDGVGAALRFDIEMDLTSEKIGIIVEPIP